MSDRTIEERQIEASERARVRRIFSEIPEVRADGFDALKRSWAYHAESFQTSELATMPLENCAVMAAKRDATKSFIDWLEKL